MRRLAVFTVLVVMIGGSLSARATARKCGGDFRVITSSEAYLDGTGAVRRTDLHTHLSGILPFERMAFMYANEIVPVKAADRAKYRQEGARDNVDAEKRILLQRIFELVLTPPSDLPKGASDSLGRIPSIHDYLAGRRAKWATEKWWQDGTFDKSDNFHRDLKFWQQLPEHVLNSMILRVSRGMPETKGGHEIPFDEVYALNTALMYDFRDSAKDAKAAADAYLREVANFLKWEGMDYVEASLYHGTFFSREKDRQGRSHPLISEHQMTDKDLRVRFLAGVTNDFLWRNNPDARAETLARLEDVLKRMDVTGVDIFGGESHAISRNRNGYDSFKAMFDLLKKHAVGSRKLVFRTHIGEGYAAGDPKHRETARDNIETMLNYLERLEAVEKYDFRKGPVIFRLGHFTAATPDQVRRAARLGVMLEFPLTSNIVTGALPDAAPGGSVYDGHPILQAIHAQAKFVLATDGHTVSHSTMETELRRMAHAIARFTAGDVKIDVGKGDLKTYAQLPPAEKALFDNAFRTLNETTNEYRLRIGLPRK